MRLACAWFGRATKLFAAVTDRYYDLDDLSPDSPLLRGCEDVRDLLLRGTDALETLRKALESAPPPGARLDDLELAPPVLNPSAIVCVGRNYPLHVAEGNVEMPTQPLLFSKFSNTLCGHTSAVPYPSITNQLDYEGELAVVIGRTAAAVTESAAWDAVAGYTVINDISARDLQDFDHQWIRGKSLDCFAPLGPVVVTADEADDPYGLRIQTRVNGEMRQNALVDEMHFRIPQLLAFITAGITLQPGDIVATGTPAGVGAGFDPPRYLTAGDVVEVSIDRIGVLRSVIK